MMRGLFSKVVAGSMIVGAPLALAACGHSEPANTAADTNMTDMNTVDSSQGLSNDASAMDATANDATSATDNGAAADTTTNNAM